jgi:hypothetical protein
MAKQKKYSAVIFDLDGLILIRRRLPGGRISLFFEDSGGAEAGQGH